MVVIGGGTAGLVSAAGAAGLGAKVALIERNLLGGDCLECRLRAVQRLIRAARAAYDARNGAEFGIHDLRRSENWLRRGHGTHAPAARWHQRP